MGEEGKKKEKGISSFLLASGRFDERGWEREEEGKKTPPSKRLVRKVDTRGGGGKGKALEGASGPLVPNPDYFRRSWQVEEGERKEKGVFSLLQCRMSIAFDDKWK